MHRSGALSKLVLACFIAVIVASVVAAKPAKAQAAFWDGFVNAVRNALSGRGSTPQQTGAPTGGTSCPETPPFSTSCDSSHAGQEVWVCVDGSGLTDSWKCNGGFAGTEYCWTKNRSGVSCGNDKTCVVNQSGPSQSVLCIATPTNTPTFTPSPTPECIYGQNSFACEVSATGSYNYARKFCNSSSKWIDYGNGTCFPNEMCTDGDVKSSLNDLCYPAPTPGPCQLIGPDGTTNVSQGQSGTVYNKNNSCRSEQTALKCSSGRWATWSNTNPLRIGAPYYIGAQSCINALGTQPVCGYTVGGSYGSATENNQISLFSSTSGCSSWAYTCGSSSLPLNQNTSFASPPWFRTKIECVAFVGSTPTPTITLIPTNTPTFNPTRTPTPTPIRSGNDGCPACKTRPYPGASCTANITDGTGCTLVYTTFPAWCQSGECVVKPTVTPTPTTVRCAQCTDGGSCYTVGQTLPCTLTQYSVGSKMCYFSGSSYGWTSCAANTPAPTRTPTPTTRPVATNTPKATPTFTPTPTPAENCGAMGGTCMNSCSVGFAEVSGGLCKAGDTGERQACCKAAAPCGWCAVEGTQPGGYERDSAGDGSCQSPKICYKGSSQGQAACSGQVACFSEDQCGDAVGDHKRRPAGTCSAYPNCGVGNDIGDRNCAQRFSNKPFCCEVATVEGGNLKVSQKYPDAPLTDERAYILDIELSTPILSPVGAEGYDANQWSVEASVVGANGIQEGKPLNGCNRIADGSGVKCTSSIDKDGNLGAASFYRDWYFGSAHYVLKGERQDCARYCKPGNESSGCCGWNYGPDETKWPLGENDWGKANTKICLRTTLRQYGPEGKSKGRWKGADVVCIDLANRPTIAPTATPIPTNTPTVTPTPTPSLTCEVTANQTQNAAGKSYVELDLGGRSMLYGYVRPSKQLSKLELKLINNKTAVNAATFEVQNLGIGSSSSDGMNMVGVYNNGVYTYRFQPLPATVGYHKYELKAIATAADGSTTVCENKSLSPTYVKGKSTDWVQSYLGQAGDAKGTKPDLNGDGTVNLEDIRSWWKAETYQVPQQ